MKACPRNSFLRIIAEVSPSPRHILYAVWRFAAPQILHLRINLFLLELIIRRSYENALQNLVFAYKVEDISVPAAHFIRSLKIRRPSNPAFAYKLVPFITYYTQVSRDALQNRRTAYNSIPFATDYTRILEKAQQNLDFAYKAEGCLRPFTSFSDTTKRRPMRRLFKFSEGVCQEREGGMPSAARLSRRR